MLKYYLRALIFKIILSAGCILSGFCGFAQLEITGPKCIIPGVKYQYMVSGSWKPESTVKVCITGGKLSGDSICTADGTRPFMVFVTWNANERLKKIEMTSSLGSTSIGVTATENLDGGLLKESGKSQEYDEDKSDYVFQCKDPRGGHCSPNYIYQWQYSENAVMWTDIKGETAKDLKYTGPGQTEIFFRRMTIETNSNSIAYSDIGKLTVKFQ